MKPAQYARKWHKVHGRKDEVALKVSMWEKLRDMRQKLQRPSNSFTRREYMEKFGLSRPTAGRALQKMCRDGIIRRCIPRASASTYYMLVEDEKPKEEKKKK